MVEADHTSPIVDAPIHHAAVNLAAPTDTFENHDVAPVDTANPGDSAFVSLYLNVGKRDGANLEHVVQALAAAGIDSAHTGAVTVKARHSYVQVAPTVQELAISRLNGMDICGRAAHAEVARPRSGE